MNTLMKYSNNNSATVCAGKNCVTVYGETASIIQQIAIFTAVVIAAVTIAKALR
jgi:hypothetical protein